MLGTLGAPEIAIIFILALVLFGPELGRTIGKAMNQFRNL
jgi:Sec-independent protein translocase protein TatA